MARSSHVIGGESEGRGYRGKKEKGRRGGWGVDKYGGRQGQGAVDGANEGVIFALSHGKSLIK